MYNDFLLIRKMKQGDDNAFDLFVHKYYQEILSYCYHHCFDQTYAEDLTQETFIRFFTKLSDYHYKGKTLNYLYTIAGDLCKDYLKWIVLSSIHDEIYLKRSMGVVATLFVILIIPELWKNRSCECMEIEAASYYSLKQVYATRMLLFGVTDIFFITVFLGFASAGLHYELSELVVQFLFPLCVTACICFGILCSKHAFSETVAIVLCVIWSAVWLFIVLNENVYIMVTVPIWSALLGATILFIAFAIYRVLKNCNQYLEVSFDEIRA